ncbi:MAG: hypothetical protein ACTSQF_15470 [Candidatus Heimdallarchaeaceae archaeon]
MTTIIDNMQTQPLVKSLRELQTPLFLINGKLKRIDKSSDHRHVSIFTEAFLQFQYLNDLLQESHSNDVSFNNDDMLAYFLAILDATLILHGQELQEKHLYRILKFWGVEKELSVFSRKITQAKSILENANLLRDNSKICTEELLFKSNLLIDYLKDILPQHSYQLEQILEHTETLAQKGISPYASVSDAALIMIVSFFPLYLDIPAAKLCIMLHLQKDLQINLTVLKKDVARFAQRLDKFKLQKFLVA